MEVGGRLGVCACEREGEEKWEIFLAAANHFNSAVAREHRDSALVEKRKRRTLSLHASSCAPMWIRERGR